MAALFQHGGVVKRKRERFISAVDQKCAQRALRAGGKYDVCTPARARKLSESQIVTGTNETGTELLCQMLRSGAGRRRTQHFNIRSTAHQVDQGRTVVRGAELGPVEGTT